MERGAAWCGVQRAWGMQHPAPCCSPHHAAPLTTSPPRTPSPPHQVGDIESMPFVEALRQFQVCGGAGEP